MELVVLRALVGELAERILGQRIAQFHALPPRHLVVSFPGTDERLWFAADPDGPILTTRSHAIAAPARPPGFVMAVRKRARGRRVTAFGLINDDRVVELAWSGSGRLVFELVPRRCTALLCDDDVVAATWNAPRGRPGPGERYAPPEAPSKIELDDVVAGQWSAWEQLEGRPLRVELTRIQGITPLVARGIGWRRSAGQPLRVAAEEEREAALGGSGAFLYAPTQPQNLRTLPPADRFFPSTFRLGGDQADTSRLTATEFGSVEDAVSEYYDLRARLGALDRVRSQAGSAIRTRLRSLRRLADKLAEPDHPLDDIAALRQRADLLLGQPTAPVTGDIVVVRNDYGDGAPLEIRVDPELSAVENARHFYRRAQRLERKIEHDARRRGEIAAQAATLENTLEHLDRAGTTPGEIRLLVDRLTAAGVAPSANATADLDALAPLNVDPTARRHQPAASRAGRTDPQTEPGIRSYRTDRYEVLVGRNATSNDRLTHRLAERHDWWLHAVGPGSHVILRNPRRLEQPPPDALLVAATLAAWFSKSRNSGSTEVHWTQARYLRKPRRGAPGAVLMQRHHSIRVQPMAPADALALAD